MAFSTLHYWSQALGKQVAAHVLIPEGTRVNSFPVLYLLHGYSDDHTMWTRRTSIERYLNGLPLMVVMPDGGKGFYCDAVVGLAYQTAIASDLIKTIDATYRTRAERSGRCIGGLSMGGYGAIKLALQYSDLFVSAHSHSGALTYGHGFWQDQKEMQWILGDHVAGGGPNDLYQLAKEADPATWPAMRLDCGVDDFLIEDNRAFHRHLIELKRPHEYQEYPGAHDWAYWDTHIQKALQFHLKQLGMVAEA